MIGFNTRTSPAASDGSTSRTENSIRRSAAPADVSGWTAPEPRRLEEPLVAWLRAEEQHAAWGRLERPPQQLAPDALLAELGIDHHLGHGAEEIAVGQHAHRSDQSVPAPCADVDRGLQRLRGLLRIVVPLPDSRGQRNKCFDGQCPITASILDRHSLALPSRSTPRATASALPDDMILRADPLLRTSSAGDQDRSRTSPTCRHTAARNTDPASATRPSPVSCVRPCTIPHRGRRHDDSACSRTSRTCAYPPRTSAHRARSSPTLRAAQGSTHADDRERRPA